MKLWWVVFGVTVAAQAPAVAAPPVRPLNAFGVDLNSSSCISWVVYEPNSSPLLLQANSGGAMPAKDQPLLGAAPTVALDDGTVLPLDPEGLLVPSALRGRYVVQWNSPLTVAEADGAIPVKLRDAPLTLDLRDAAGAKQALVRLRVPSGQAAIKLRLRPAIGNAPVRLEIAPVGQEGLARAGGKPFRLGLEPEAAEVEVVPVEGAVTVRVVDSDR